MASCAMKATLDSRDSPSHTILLALHPERPSTGSLAFLLLMIWPGSPQDCEVLARVSRVTVGVKILPCKKSAVRRRILEWIKA